MEKHVQMLLILFGVCITSVHTLEWTNVPVEMGQNITLNCSFVESNVIWNMQLLGGCPVRILKIFNKLAEDADYDNGTFEGRYSVKPGNRLCIHNVTLEEKSFYYCTKTLDTNFFNETFHLVPASKLPNKQNKVSQMDFTFWVLVFLVVVSLPLNLILIKVVLAARSHNRPSQPYSDHSPVTSDSPGNPTATEYEEIPLRNPVQGQASPPVGAVAVSGFEPYHIHQLPAPSSPNTVQIVRSHNRPSQPYSDHSPVTTDSPGNPTAAELDVATNPITRSPLTHL